MSAEGELIDRFEADAYADHLNMALVEVRPGYARAEMEAAEEFAGFQGFLHAGAVASLAEYAFAVASSSHGTSAVPLTITFTLVGLVRPGGRLVAEAVEEKLGRRTGLYKLEVRLDDGSLVASGQGVAYRPELSASG